MHRSNLNDAGAKICIEVVAISINHELIIFLYYFNETIEPFYINRISAQTAICINCQNPLETNSRILKKRGNSLFSLKQITPMDAEWWNASEKIIYNTLLLTIF